MYTPQTRTTTIITPGTQSYGQPSPSILTPTATTPGGNYGHSQFTRPQSSHSHSSSTPVSAQSHTQNFPRDSPHTVQTQSSSQYHRHSNQSYQSQPGTPLGPPPTINRPSPILHREGSGSYAYDHQRRQSGGSLSSQAAILSPTADGTRLTASSPTGYSPQRQPPRYRTDEERERSLSVSPKTRLPSQTRSGIPEASIDYQRNGSGQLAGLKRKGPEQHLDERSVAQSQQQGYQHYHAANGPSNSMVARLEEQERVINKGPVSTPAQQPRGAISPTLNTSFSGGNHLRQIGTEQYQATTLNHALSSMQPSRGQIPPPLPISTHHSNTPSSAGLPTPTFSRPVSSAPILQSTDVKLETLDAKAEAPNIKVESSTPPSLIDATHQPTRKRPRLNEPPVYAQKANRGNPLLLNRRPLPKTSSVKLEILDNSSQGSMSGQPVKFEGTNGHQAAPFEVPLPTLQLEHENVGPLGPWEKSIINQTPHEELTKTVADFIFSQVVLRDDIGSVPGAVLEIEAKLGQIIDKNTNDRLRLPVLTECVLNKSDPSFRTIFKSSMTEVSATISPKDRPHTDCLCLVPASRTESLP